ncbi:MAG: hypothetical protein Kow0031_06270 [Anaerolineae bacterium]
MTAANNPYIIDGPILDDAVFFGRSHLTEIISDVLRYPAHTSVIVFGQRKMGKSSLLRHLERAMRPPFFPVYYDLSGKAMDSVSQVLLEMATAAARNAHIQPPNPADFEHNPDAFHTQFLPALYQALGHQMQPTFLLDEFDAINIPETELPEDAAVRNLDTYLYKLLTTQSHTDFVFAAGRRMNELSAVQSSGYQANLTQYLPVLSPDHTRALILQPGAPAYNDDAVAYILDATRGHPYLTQLLCHTLFKQTQPRPEPITVKDVKTAQAALIGATDNDIAKIWDSIPDAEQLTLAAAAEAATASHAVIPAAVLENTLLRADVPVTLPQIRSAPRNLVNWQMLQQSGGGYTFYTDLLRRWIAANRPLDQIKEAELAQLGPKTEQLYQLALLAQRRGEPAEALARLDEALAANPNHLGALMLKGEILAAQNQPAAAVETYDRAFGLSPLLAAGGLAGALALLGQQQEQAGNNAAALESYRRALKIDPKNQLAATGEAGLQAKQARPDAAQPQPEPPAAEAAPSTGPVAATEPAPPEGEATAEKRQNWWPLAVAAVLLLLLCGWLYSSGLLAPPAATPETTVAAQTGAGQNGDAAGTAAAAEKAATESAVATATAGAEIDAGGTAAAATANAEASAAANATAEAGTTTGQSGAGGDSSGGDASGSGRGDNSEIDSAATATAEAENAAAESSSQGGAPLSGVININGSPTLNPLFQQLAAEFSAKNPGVQLNISGSSSQSGLASVLGGSSDIALLGRDLSPDELAALNGAQLFTLPQQDHVAVVTHPLIPVSNLSAAQLRDIFAGDITNWQEVGGPDAPIVPVLPAEDSDTRQVFLAQVMGDDATLSEAGAVVVDSDSEVLAEVSSRPNAIGFAAAAPQSAEARLSAIAQTESWPVIDTGLLAAKSLTIDQAAPGSDAYPVRRPINLVAPAEPPPATQALVDFIYSPEGQRIIEQLRRTEGSTP